MKHILKTSLLLVALLTCAQSFGQKFSFNFSGAGSGLWTAYFYLAMNDVDGAIDYLEDFNANDSNYVGALALLSDCYMKQDNYKKAASVCEKGYHIESDDRLGLYLSHIEAATKLRDADKVNELLPKAMKLAPYNYSLQAAKAKAVIISGNIDEGLDMLYDQIRKAPRDPSAHKALGEICFDQGLFAQGLLAYNMYFILSGENSDAATEVADVNVMMTQKLEANEGDDEVFVGCAEVMDEGFEYIDNLVANKVALSRGFDVDSKLDFPIIRQSNLVVKQIKTANGNGFWHEFYIPWMKKHVISPESFDLYSYATLESSQGSSDIAKIFKKKGKKITAFKEDALDDLKSMAKGSPTDLFGNPISGEFLYEDGIIEGMGELVDGEKQGMWTTFQGTGAVSGKGEYKDDERQGKWTFYFDNGDVSGEVEYVDGELNGPFTYYYYTGGKSSEGTWKEGVLDGNYKRYYFNGNLKVEREYTEGKKDGLSTTYYIIGGKKTDIHFEEGAMNGEYIYYYEDGSIKIKANYSEGSRDGKYEEFYRNGQTKYSMTYDEGDLEGEYFSYYSNGQRYYKQFFEKGYREGDLTKYFDNGEVEVEESAYSKGEISGYGKAYDRDGNLLYKITYEDGNRVGYRYYSPDGSTIAKKESDEVEWEGEQYYPNGSLWSEGVYKSGEKSGEWESYTSDGFLAGEYNYSYGNQSGEQRSFYKNGATKVVFTLASSGNYNGSYTYFYKNGVLKTEGEYAYGSQDDEWKYQAPNDSTTHVYYFDGGVINGYAEHYNNEGLLSYKGKFINGSLMGEIYYDTAGNSLDTIMLEGGNGTLVRTYSNGQKRFEGEYVSGMAHGVFIWYYPNGQIETKGAYYNDMRNGTWTDYYQDGTIEEIRVYVYGDLDSTNLEFDRYGKKDFEATYKEDDLDGLATSYYLGSDKIRWTANYVEGEKHGEMIYFSENGEEILKKLYVNGDYSKVAVRNADGEMGEYKEIATFDTVRITAYHSNGNLAITYKLDSGELSGTLIQNFSSGKRYKEAEYDNGDRHGASKLYSEDGTLLEEAEYAFDELSGEMKIYDLSGNLTRKVTYLYGEKDGVTTVYEGGREIGTAYYFDNIYYDGTTK